MSVTMIPNIKLIAVFGVGATLTATYSTTDVEYKDANTALRFALPAGSTTKPVGVYDVVIVSDTEMKETLAAEQPKPAVEAAAKPKVKQSPAFGFESRVTR